MQNEQGSTDSTTRRTFLASSAVGTASALAGCGRIVDSFFDEELSIEPPPFGPLVTDWPQFGYDAGRTRYAPEVAGPLGEMSVAWETRPRLNGAPAMALHHDRLVVTGDETLYAYDLAAGEQAWTVGLESGEEEPWRVGSVHPVLDDEHAYAAAADTTVAAYDRESGETAWTVSLDEPIHPALAYDDVLYVAGTEGTLVAVEPATGSERWRRSLGSPRNYRLDRRNAVVVDDGRPIYVRPDGIVALDPGDGSTQWERAFPDVEGPVAARDGTLYAVLRERPEPSEDTDYQWYNLLRAIDTESGTDQRRERGRHDTGDWVWPHDVEKREDLDGYGATLAVDEEQVFLMDGGNLDVVETGTARSTLQRRLSETKPFVVAGRSLFGASNFRGEHTTLLRFQFDEMATTEHDTRLDGAVTETMVAGEWAFVSTNDGYLYGITGN